MRFRSRRQGAIIKIPPDRAQRSAGHAEEKTVMQRTLQIVFRNMDPSEAVEADVRERAERLERFYDRITGCRVVVQAPHRHHYKGKLYDVRIDIDVPGEAIVVQRSGPENQAHENVYVAVRDAFSAATRRLQDHVRKVGGRVKAHEAAEHGRVVRVFHERGYGFIESADGEEIYFHRNSVVDGSFDAVEVGQEVRMAVAHGESEHGAQASTVRPVGKHHVVG
jgi:cold shock CspA family protein